MTMTTNLGLGGSEGLGLGSSSDSNLDWHSFWNGPEHRILLAPMEGVVDGCMRDLITRIGGIDLCVTEFIRVTDRVPEADLHRDCPEFQTGCRTRAGTPVLVQLLGGQPEPMAESAVRAFELGSPGIDLNFGCPAKTVNRHDGGAALLKNPHRVHDVVSAVRKALPKHIPVSAKVRLGFENKDRHLEIAEAAASGGAAWLTVHARTRDEGYRPPAHWEYIARMREVVNIPVIANGEIWSPDDYHRAREISGCRHVMIGRGLMTSPDLARLLKGKGPLAAWPEAAGWLLEFAELSRAFRSDHYAVCRVKQWARSLARRFTEAAAFFEEIKRHEELPPIIDRLRDRKIKQKLMITTNKEIPWLKF